MVLAHGKINLFLHVTGKQNDGYHQLQSLMVPLVFGDRLEVQPNASLSVEVIGSDLANMPPENNLVMKAARALQAATHTTKGAHILLHKHIPHAAGLGGGSSDAAHTLLALQKLWQTHIDLLPIAEKVGADVPFFLNNSAQYAEGIGEKLTAVNIPLLYVLLVKPHIEIPTATIFAKGFSQFSKTIPLLHHFDDAQSLITFLKPLKNDLTENAISVAPVIADILSRLEDTNGCLMARMSGSGATCFGIFADAKSCEVAVQLFAEHWVQVTQTL